MGAMGASGWTYLNPDLSALVSSQDLAKEKATQLEVLHAREAAYFHDREALSAQGRTVIVLDDGMATGMTALAGLTSLRQIGPARLTLAVPILDGAILRRVEPLVDALEWLKLVGGLGAVGAWYEDFPQLQDDQVLELLAGRGARAASAGSGWPGRET